MESELQKWKGLLKWSMAQTAGTSASPQRPLSEEDKKFFQDAIHSNTLDIVQRMREITIVMSLSEQELKDQYVATDDLIEMLEELQDCVAQIDYANDLHSIGGLVPLLRYLANPEPRVRAKAAEVVNTVVQNNPQSQRNVLDSKGMELLMHNASKDSDAIARAKAMGAIGALVRNNPAGLASFHVSNGYSALRDALSSEDPKLQRKALNLLRSILSESPGPSETPGHSKRSGASGIADQPGLIRTLSWLVNSPDVDVREAALAALSDVAGQSHVDAKRVAGEAGLEDALAGRVDDLTKLKGEDLAAAQDELRTIGDLWNKCGFGEQGPRRKLLEALSTIPPLDTGVVGGERESKPYSIVTEKKADEGEKKAPLLLGAPGGRGR